VRKVLFAIAAFTALGTAAAVAATVTPTALATAPATYDGKTVTAAGTVKDFQTSRTLMGTVAGYQLCDASKCIVVIDQQNHPQSNGATATVTGTFHATFKGPKKTFNNAIVIAK